MIQIKNQVAFLFPGQGSQSLGMGKHLADTYPTAKNVFDQADQLLGVPLSRIAWDDPTDQLNDTVNTQPALFVHSIASLRVLQEQFPNLQPSFVAGHSMGELTALVSVGSLDFEAGLSLVRTRGELMKQAGEKSPGGMAAIIGVDIDLVDEICSTASLGTEIVQIANDNCPGQVVISGSSNGLEQAMTSAKKAGARKVIRLAVSIAAHSPLMNHAQDGFNRAVDAVPLKDPLIPIIGNVNAQPLNQVGDIREDLQAQLYSRVRWTESVRYMLSSGITNFIEIGNNSVLTGLLKRIDRQAHGYPFGNPENFEKISSISQ
jgi:[acyl-carrier-protein] S-malonyltransferase